MTSEQVAFLSAEQLQKLPFAGVDFSLGRGETPSSMRTDDDFTSTHFGGSAHYSSPDHAQTSSSDRDASPDTDGSERREEGQGDGEAASPASSHLADAIHLTLTPAPTASDRDESPDTAATATDSASTADGEAVSQLVPQVADDTAALGAALSVSGFPDIKPHDIFAMLAAKAGGAAAAAGGAFPFPMPFPIMPAAMPPMPAMPAQRMTGQTLNPDGTPKKEKRKRQRRNPVWPYFEVNDGTAYCKQCLYSTKSVFSTNLKVHLRSHHRADYEKVIEAEDALNLNALLLSGNAGVGNNNKRNNLPPMTSSILMTINKLANQATAAAAAGQPTATGGGGGGEESPLNSVLRQTLAAGSLTQQLQHNPQGGLALNATNLATLNMARSQLAQAMAGGGPASPADIFAQLGLPTPPKNASGTTPTGAVQPKKRRLRRHPVWMYYKDLEDRMVGCINCDFRTGSAFSTNLKMHLRAHHKEDYAKVLQLEDEMRVDEGIFGPPNKIKSELISFIRGGGNAATPIEGSNSSAPSPSPLVRQLISQTMAGGGGGQQKEASPASAAGTPPAMPFNFQHMFQQQIKTEPEHPIQEEMSAQDRLAALVGLREETPTEAPAAAEAANPFEELRRAAERIAAVNMGVEMQGGEGSVSEKSAAEEEERKADRDRALSRLLQLRPELKHCDAFNDAVRALAPDYTLPAEEEKAEEEKEKEKEAAPAMDAMSMFQNMLQQWAMPPQV